MKLRNLDHLVVNKRTMRKEDTEMKEKEDTEIHWTMLKEITIREGRHI